MLLKCVVCGGTFIRHHRKKRMTCSQDCLEALRIINTKKYHLTFRDRLVMNRTKVNYPIEKKYSEEAQKLMKEWHLPER